MLYLPLRPATQDDGSFYLYVIASTRAEQMVEVDWIYCPNPVRLGWEQTFGKDIQQ